MTTTRRLLAHRRQKARARGCRRLRAIRSRQVKWSRDLKQRPLRGTRIRVRPQGKLRRCTYRPFHKEASLLDRVLIDEVSLSGSYFPDPRKRPKSTHFRDRPAGDRKPVYVCLWRRTIVDLHLTGPGCSTQCFPFYTYAEDGTNRRENITDWALERIPRPLQRPQHHQVGHLPLRLCRAASPRVPRALRRQPQARTAPHPVCGRQLHLRQSAVASASQKQIPPDARGASRLRAARNDKGEGDRVKEGDPAKADATVFRAFVKAGQRLAEIHVNYEQQPEYPLKQVEKAGEKLDWRVTKMRLSKDKTTLTYNQFLTLSGIPPEVYEYRLGNRSALEWVIDQYQVSTDKRSGIVNDPNRADDPQYILRLIGQVVTVSLETVKTVKSLPRLDIESAP